MLARTMLLDGEILFELTILLRGYMMQIVVQVPLQLYKELNS